MAIRQQQVVFAFAALIVGYGAYRSFTASTFSSRDRAGRAPEFEDHLAPDVDLVRPEKRDPSALLREFFTEPSDTRPLPPLDFEVPPLVSLPGLRPAPAAGPMPSMFAQYLRTNIEPQLVAGLFDEQGDDGGSLDEAFEDAGTVDWDLLTAEEKAERLESYRRQYDWLRTNQVKYGRILNRDRFKLRMPISEPILFLELDPMTGQERFPGMAPVAYDQERHELEDFGLADTLLNRLELERVDFPEELTRGQFGAVMAFADRAYLAREAGPRALEIAAEFYGKAAKLTSEPAPRLGLARCFEAGFEFEKAFAEYRSLIDGGFANHPVVLARLGVLESRFRLFDQAEAHLAEASRFGRSEWEVQLALGNFKLRRDQPAEALEALQRASRNEPQAAEHQRVRAWIRSLLGDAQLATGQLDEARKSYAKALQAEPGLQSALAGLQSVDYLEGATADSSSGSAEPEELSAPEFELLLAEGLVAAQRGDWVAAVENLTLAADSDPLRAGRAWRALSWVAEVTDQPEEALRFIELATTIDPTDVYTLLQRGRVLAARDDVEGAAQAFTAALDQELRLPDALAGLGRLAFLDGRFADAEMYLERSVFVDPSQTIVHSLRGLNALMQGDVVAARDSFEAATAGGKRDVTSRAGLAWCAYLEGEPVESITLYRELDDSLRARPEDDPLRLYVARQIKRIDDHVEKVAWSDRFERQQLLNGWVRDEGAGPLVTLHDGAVFIDGNFTETGRSRLRREYPAGDFLSIEVTLEVARDNRCRVGAFVSLEQARRDDTEIKAEATISRNLDGTLQTRLQRRGGEDAAYVDVPVVEWRAGEPVVLRIDRTGESSDTEMRLSIDGVPVADKIPMSELGRTTSKLWVGVFAEGDTGRIAKVRIDRVEIIKRER